MTVQEPSQRSGWTGWITFASVLIILSSILSIIAGFVAVFSKKVILSGADHTAVLSVSSWGWAHVAWGLFLLMVGIGLLSGNFLARIFGVLGALVSLVLSFFALFQSPVWAGIVIIIDLLIIWAIMAHGKEMKKS